MQYGAKVLFRNASINFDPGKRYGLVGANGAGKSTLLRILTNDENPTEGKVSVPKELKLGFLRQDHFSYEDHVIIHVVMKGKKRLWQAMEMKEELLAKEEMDEKTGHQLAELEIRRQNREEARIVLEAEKAENALKQKLVERLERFSRNMKSIVFQINKRYITKKRPPLRFVDNITESGECLIKNDDAPTDKDYLILLYVEGEDVSQRLNNPICLDDKTDVGYPKNFQPKNIFDASDYIIDRLAVMFDKERKLKK